MRVDVQYRIKNNFYLNEYLKRHSYWYKELNRNPLSIYEIEEEMKKEYKLNPEDKVRDFSKKIEMLSSFIDILN